MWRRRLFFGQIRSTENYEFSVNVDNYNIIMDMVFLYKGAVDLRLGILILADDDGIVVLPQEQIVPHRSAGQNGLLKRQIVTGIL